MAEARALQVFYNYATESSNPGVVIAAGQRWHAGVEKFECARDLARATLPTHLAALFAAALHDAHVIVTVTIFNNVASARYSDRAEIHRVVLSQDNATRTQQLADLHNAGIHRGTHTPRQVHDDCPFETAIICDVGEHVVVDMLNGTRLLFGVHPDVRAEIDATPASARLALLQQYVADALAK